MKLFYFIIYYCLVSSVVTLISSILNNDYNYLTFTISIFGLISSIAVNFTKKTNLLFLLLIWYLLATFLPQAIKLDFIFSVLSNFRFTIGGIGLNFNILYLIPTILLISYYGQLSFIFKSLKGTVYTSNGEIPFGTEIKFELNEFKGKILTGETNFAINGIDYKKITFKKVQNSNKSLASIKVFNEEKNLTATIKLN